LFEFEQSGRRSTTSSVGGHGQIQDELRYTTEPDEAGIESPAMRDLQYAPLTAQEQKKQQQQPVEIERQQLVDRTVYERREKPHELDINSPTMVCVCVHVYMSLISTNAQWYSHSSMLTFI